MYALDYASICRSSRNVLSSSLEGRVCINCCPTRPFERFRGLHYRCMESVSCWSTSIMLRTIDASDQLSKDYDGLYAMYSVYATRLASSKANSVCVRAIAVAWQEQSGDEEGRCCSRWRLLCHSCRRYWRCMLTRDRALQCSSEKRWNP